MQRITAIFTLVAALGVANTAAAGKGHHHDDGHHVHHHKDERPTAPLERNSFKAAAPVRQASQVRYEAAIGQTVAVPLDFNLTQAADEVRVVVYADDGLTIASPTTVFAFENVAPGRLALPMFDVTVDQAGRLAVHATVEVINNGKRRMAAYSVPVGAPNAKALMPPKQLKSDASGQTLRVMPARETQ